MKRYRRSEKTRTPSVPQDAEGKVFPPHSMIMDAPAKLVRTLDEATVAAIGKGAEHYVENSRRYAEELQPWQAA